MALAPVRMAPVSTTVVSCSSFFSPRSFFRPRKVEPPRLEAKGLPCPLSRNARDFVCGCVAALVGSDQSLPGSDQLRSRQSRAAPSSTPKGSAERFEFRETHRARLTETRPRNLEPRQAFAQPSHHRSITGGDVYRGTAIPSLVGKDIFGDYVSNEIWALDHDVNGVATTVQLNTNGPSGSWTSFGQGLDGELYAVDLLKNANYTLVPGTGSGTGSFPTTLSATGCVGPAHPLVPASGMIPDDVVSPLYADGAGKGRYLALPDGLSATVAANGPIDLPIGSVTMKSFAIGGTPVETRIMMRHSDGEWGGYSYKWRADGRAATSPHPSRSLVSHQGVRCRGDASEERALQECVAAPPPAVKASFVYLFGSGGPFVEGARAASPTRRAGRRDSDSLRPLARLGLLGRPAARHHAVLLLAAVVAAARLLVTALVRRRISHGRRRVLRLDRALEHVAEDNPRMNENERCRRAVGPW